MLSSIAGLIGIDGGLFPFDQAEGVMNLANPHHRRTNANNVFAMIKNAFRAPSFAPVFA